MLLTDHQVKAAREYVDKQLATMEKYGSAPKLSPEAYGALVLKVAKVAAKATRKWRSRKATG